MNQSEVSSRCYDIQSTLKNTEIPEFDVLPKIGMMVNISIHIKGFPLIDYEKLKLISSQYLGVPSFIFRDIILSLADLEFVKLQKSGGTINKILPDIPFFENVYDRIGDYASTSYSLNEAENLTIAILTKLSESPTEVSNLYNMGADKKLVDRSLTIGKQGGYVGNYRARGKDIILSSLFFSENSEVLSDMVAKSGAKNVKRILDLIKAAQGWPMSIIEKTSEINGKKISKSDIELLKKLAQEGVVKPPSINTPHAGNNHFIFTPSPGGSKLNPANKEIHERAMALVCSVRQGQLLAKKYGIRSPTAILRTLQNRGKLGANSEALNQYNQLVKVNVGFLEPAGGDMYSFRLHDTEENKRALEVAINLLESGEVSGMEVDENVKIALQKDQSYIESLIASSEFKKTERVELDEEKKEELDNLLIQGTLF